MRGTTGMGGVRIPWMLFGQKTPHALQVAGNEARMEGKRDWAAEMSSVQLTLVDKLMYLLRIYPSVLEVLSLSLNEYGECN